MKNFRRNYNGVIYLAVLISFIVNTTVIAQQNLIIDYSDGFYPNDNRLKLNNIDPGMNNNRLCLTENQYYENTSAYFSENDNGTPSVNIIQFETNFNFKITKCNNIKPEDGFTFIIQNRDENLVGGDADRFGYIEVEGSSPRNRKIGVWFEFAGAFDEKVTVIENGEEISKTLYKISTGLFINEDYIIGEKKNIYELNSGFRFYDGNTYNVHITYINNELTVVITDIESFYKKNNAWDSQVSYKAIYDVNIQSIMGSDSAWVGFTGGTGWGGHAKHEIINWVFSNEINNYNLFNTPSNLYFDTSSCFQTIDVFSNIEWSVSNNNGWLNVYPDHGSGNGQVIITVDSLENDVSRTDTVTIEGEYFKRKIIVNQEIPRFNRSTENRFIFYYPLIDFEDNSLGLYNMDEIEKDWPIIKKDYIAGLDRTYITTDLCENKMMRINYDSNSVGLDTGGAQWDARFQNDDSTVTEHLSEIYFSYDIKFKPGFKWVQGGKLPGVKGYPAFYELPGDITSCPVDTAGFTATLMWTSDGGLQTYIYDHNITPCYGPRCYGRGGQFMIDPVTPFIFETNKWYNLTIRVSLNDLTQSNGIMEGFIDGKRYKMLVMDCDGNKEYRDFNDMNFRKTENIDIDNIRFYTHFGGSSDENRSVREEWIELDNFVLFNYNEDTINNSIARGNNLSNEDWQVILPALPSCIPFYKIVKQVEICEGDSVYVNGTYQTISGNYYDTLKTINSCDSIIITNLLVNPESETSVFINICEGDSYFVQGAEQILPGLYYDTLQTIKGCDSIIITNLTVDDIYEIVLNISICEGKSYFAQGGEQTLPDLYNDTLQAVTGCDSVIITDLMVNPGFEIFVNINICGGESYFAQGAEQTLPGLYYDTLLTVNGCDSIVVTNLTVMECEMLIDNFNVENIEVYPVPTTRFLNIQPEGFIKYELYDSQGKQIRISNENRVDFFSFQEGLYILKIIDKDGNIYIKKVIYAK